MKKQSIRANFVHRVMIFLLAVALCQGILWPVSGLSEEPGDPVKTGPLAAPGDRDDGLLRSLARMAPAGWHLLKPVKVFNHENLYEQIDGRADFFLSYDMVRMTFAAYADSS
ncbi:MAG: DUF6599 family protein, partial [Pseudomonadota bacterium]